MKTLCMIAFTVFIAMALAQDPNQKNLGEKRKMHETKSTKDYKVAKEACLKGTEGIKGKKLTECIVNYQKEAK